MRKKRTMESSGAHDVSKQQPPSVQPTAIFCLCDQEDAQFYRELQIVGLHLFWKATAGLEPWEVDDLCMQLHSLSLVQTCDLGNGTIRLHDVLRTYLLQQ